MIELEQTTVRRFRIRYGYNTITVELRDGAVNFGNWSRERFIPVVLLKEAKKAFDMVADPSEEDGYLVAKTVRKIIPLNHDEWTIQATRPVFEDPYGVLHSVKIYPRDHSCSAMEISGVIINRKAVDEGREPPKTQADEVWELVGNIERVTE